MKKLINIYIESFKGISKDIYIFALMMFINRIGTLILPFLTLYITQQLGWTKIDAGTATMWFGLGSLAGALLGGEMSNRIGYYKTMAFSLFSAAICFYLLQFVTEFYMFCGFLFFPLPAMPTPGWNCNFLRDTRADSNSPCCYCTRKGTVMSVGKGSWLQDDLVCG